MKTIISLLSACYVFIALQGSLYAQWKQMPNLPGGNRAVICLAANDSFLFAGTDQGVFRSSSNGAYWDAIDSGIAPITEVYLITANNDTLFLSTGGVIYRSLNNGESWVNVQNNLANRGIEAIAKFRNTIYVVREDSLFYSTNNGNDWIKDSIVSFPFSGSFVATPDNLFFENLYSIFRLSESTGAWVECDSGLPLTPDGPLFISSITANGDTVIVGLSTEVWMIYSGCIYRSTNNGASWDSASSGLHAGCFTESTVDAISANNGVVYAAISYGQLPDTASGLTDTLYYSTDDGNSWIYIRDSNFPAGDKIQSFVINKGSLFAGIVSNGIQTGLPDQYGDGVYMSSDSGKSWAPGNNGLTNYPVTDITAFGNNFIYGENSTTDYGIHWTEGGTAWFKDSLVNNISAVVKSGGNLLAITDDGMFLSTNNGENWIAESNAIVNRFGDYNSTGNWTYGPIVATANTIYLGSGDYGIGGAFFTTNGGASWLAADSGLPVILGGMDSLYGDIQALAVSNAAVFAAVDYTNTNTVNSIYRLSNNSGIWIEADSGIIDPWITALAACGGNIIAGTDSGIYVSTNNGANWEISERGGFYQGVSSFLVVDSTVFAGTIYGAYLSTDNGTNWESANEGLPFYGINVNTITATNNDIYIGTNFTFIWHRPLSDFGISPVVEKLTAVPYSNSILTSYPNPFSSSTNIVLSSTLQEAERVSIVDMLGREIAVLQDGMAGNAQNIVWSPDETTPAGMYWIVASGKSGVASKPVMLLR